MTTLVPNLAAVPVDPALCPREASFDAQARRLRALDRPLQFDLIRNFTFGCNVCGFKMESLRKIMGSLTNSLESLRKSIECSRKAGESLRKSLNP